MLQRDLDLIMQVDQRAVVIHSRPQDLRAPMAFEVPDAGDIEFKRIIANAQQGFMRIGGHGLVHVADEHQRKVMAAVGDPAGAVHRAVQAGQCILRGGRQFQPGK